MTASPPSDDRITLAAPRRFRLDGKRALITGASRNIGFAIATAFAHAGADLILVARGRDRLVAAADALREGSDAAVTTIVADVATSAGIETITAGVGDGAIDILVNNAHTIGHAPGSRLIDLPDAAWDDILATNLLAPFRLARHFAPRMMRQESGCIVNLMSGSGLQPSPGLGAYGASKSALWMMTKSLAVELAPHVRVNALCPGLVTEDGSPRNEAQERLLPSVPMNRIADPNEIAGAALYLASDEASYTTGELLIVNGGRPW
ncbi:SDR family oxidoreductase [Microbacterium sp. PI-1]|uniref:SDR family NAD(P)-dependent oxidoreductase n=1 Tax=Microbacterium sp. PI-1 TaxID=2545631 RepID=UPI001040A054|nr:SDR family oxidoreductase [Microbacterium sp. PI-1]TCJ21971.1 SDR family oxidoreductase [Microbacterium sp. PI-1]